MKKTSVSIVALFLLAVLTTGCSLTQVALDTKGLRQHTDTGVTSLGHVYSAHYYLTIIGLVPILPAGEPQGVQELYNGLAEEASKNGATGVSDLTSYQGSFPFIFFPIIFIHKDTMTGNMFK